MNSLVEYLPSEFSHAMGWTFIHSLWQGSVILLLYLIFQRLCRPSAIVKYWISFASMSIILIVSMVTLLLNLNTHSETLFIVEPVLLAIQNITPLQEFSLSTSLEQYLPMITLLWGIGVIFYTIKLCGGFVQVTRLKKMGVSAIPTEWRTRVTTLLIRVDINRTVKILQSTKVDMPMVLGYFKPVVLIPLGMMSGLSIDQVEAILLHELAHVKRHDFLVNTIQSMIEVIFYYHPVIWWMSAQVRKEREHCCDDQTLSMGVDKIIYSHALSNVRTTSFTQNKLTMGLANNKTDLLNRIKRMIEGKDQSSTNFYSRGIPLLLLIAVLMSFTWYRTDKIPAKVEPTAITDHELWPYSILEEFVPEPPMPIDSPRVKSKSKTTVIWTDENGEVHEVTKESGGDENDWEFMEESLGDEILDIDMSGIMDQLDVMKDLDLNFDNSFVLELDSPLLHREHLMRIEEELARVKEHMEGMYMKIDFKDDDFSNEEIRDLKEKMRKMEQVMRGRSRSLNDFYHKDRTDRESREERDQLRNMRDREREIHRRELRSSEREFSTQETQERMKEMEKAHQEREEEMKEMEKGFQLYQKELSKQLRADGYLKKGEDVDNFEMRDGAMKVNGKDIDAKHAMKYKKLKEKFLD